MPLGDGETSPDARGKDSEPPCDRQDRSSHTAARGHMETLFHRATSVLCAPKGTPKYRQDLKQLLLRDELKLFLRHQKNNLC